MTKQEFLNKLSHEELLLLRDIISSPNVIGEIKSRMSLKEQLNVEVGNCFIYKVNQNELYLLKVISQEENDYFYCVEISIDNYDPHYYNISYHVDDFRYWKPLDSNIYNKVIALIDAKMETIEKITLQCNKQVRELCLTLLNTQNKN